MTTHQIAVLPGDGIGPEVMASAQAVLEAAGFNAHYTQYDIGLSALEKHKTNLPEETVTGCRDSDAVLLGATQTPSTGNIKSATIALRKALDVYANVRPCFSLFDEAFDFVIVRENTEGLYSGREKDHEGYSEATRVVTDTASQRVAVKAFELAARRPEKKVTIVHKANILRQTCGRFRRACLQEAKKHPSVQCEEMLVDACAYNLVKNPGAFSVVVTTNLFGDILSDVGAGVVGSLGTAPSANLGDTNALFEPVHGSAPDIVGKGLANPTGMLLSAAMMVEHLGDARTSARIRDAVLQTIRDKTLTRDLGGQATTQTFTSRVIEQLQSS